MVLPFGDDDVDIVDDEGLVYFSAKLKWNYDLIHSHKTWTFMYNIT